MADATVSFPDLLAIADGERTAGRLREADELCGRLLEIRPGHPEVLHLRALIAHDRGDASRAIDFMGQAVAANEKEAHLHWNLAEMCRRAGRLDEALEASRRALTLEPRSPRALNALGATLCARREYREALVNLQRAVALAPHYATAHLNLSHALEALGRPAEALDAVNEAIRLDAAAPVGFHNRGFILHRLARFDEAEADWRHALTLDPTLLDSRIALIGSAGIAHYNGGRFDEAEAKWREVRELRPADADANMNLGISYLLRGNFTEGFALYEWRSRQRTANLPPRLAAPWQGDDPAGKRLLVHAEQGFGDTLQFGRYLPLLRERGAKLVLSVQPPLRSLVAHSMPWLELQRDTTPAADFQCTLLSLPHLLKTTPDTIPAPVPYINAPPRAISRLGAVIGEGDGLKVGLAWAGNPKHLLDKERSLAFALLAPLLAVKGVRFFSLQLGAAAREASASITDLAPELTDFAQTAGAIANLDLVISVDTAVAHLGGAMGKPVWIMLPFVPDWRWLLERKDSPWYPTARLFRQKTRGDWGPVVGEIARALARREPDRQGSTPAGMTAGMPAKRPGLAIREPSAHSTPPRQSPTGLETLAMADEPRAFYLRARIAKDAGEQPAAIEFMRRAVAANGHDVPLLCDLAEMFIVAGLLDEALAASRRALALEPHSPQALNALGTTLCARGENAEAILPLRRVIALVPDFVAAHMNLGLALRALGHLDDALEATNEAIRLSPNFANAFYNRGAIHQEMVRLAEAKDDWKHALVLDPAHKDARANLCCVHGLTLYYEQGRFDDAESHWKQAIALRPTDADAHTNLAFSYLLRGKLAEGFSHYEWRSLRKDIKHPPQLAPPWEGDDPSGKRLLIHTEQGSGDTIQFCRYLAILHERGTNLVLRAPRALRSLIAHSMPWLELQSDPKPPFDIQANLLSLPHLLKTTPETIPAPIAYLNAPPQAISRSGAVIGEGDGLKVGLVWAGSPTHFRDSDRSLPFAALAPMLAVKGVRFFSLQLGAAAREASASITDLAPELTDFAQTAGAIANLDLVISVDTAVAHLAGAMGKPVWIMLPFVPDWRWLLERKDSPWYPTARLFRQKTRGEWGPLVGEIARALEGLARASTRQQGLSVRGIAATASGAREPLPFLISNAENRAASLPAKLAVALDHRNAGRLEQADLLCGEILEIQPSHPEALLIRALVARDAQDQARNRAHAASERDRQPRPQFAWQPGRDVPQCGSPRRGARGEPASARLGASFTKGSPCARHHALRAQRIRSGSISSAARDDTRARLRFSSCEPWQGVARLGTPRRSASDHGRGHLP